ncbi:carotenoid biosynthesis protein [Nocardioides marinquilinus]|uniref:Carotenoid biosynthesis protein n=1 Tax=Nocardioides marinquilinus TaxID=1210400 RepID=A0ABP9PKU6_9ACTN
MTPRTAGLAVWAPAAAGIGVQMAFPLTRGGTPAMTTASVVLLAGASLAHAAVTRGPGPALGLLALGGGGTLVAEAVGVATGYPFGRYAYRGTLGREVLGVPALVPLAWTSMAYPALLVARTLRPGAGPASTALLAGWALTTWDVFLDPQMVDAGHWAWERPTPSLPGVDDVPLTNFAGWLVVATALGAVLDRVVPPAADARTDDQPRAVFLWTYASSVLAHAAFFGRPRVAAVGGVLMGTVGVPLARRVLARLRGRG